MQAAAWAMVLLAAAPLAAAPGAAAEGVTRPHAVVEWQTQPSADLVLSFVRPGKIAEVRVKEGDAVKPADVLVRLDDEAERVQLAQLKAQADDMIRIRAADAQVDQKREDLKKLEWAAGQGAATTWEVEHARLEVVIGELSAELAKFNKQQDTGKYEEAKVQLDRMQLKSPIAGTVEQVFVEPGESVEALAKVIRVVNTDVLWVDFPVPLDAARRLKVGQTVQVEFPAPDATTAPGKVTFIAAVSDVAAVTLTVRVELKNPGGRPAGERVRLLAAE